jgi:hypothetical protein
MWARDITHLSVYKVLKILDHLKWHFQPFWRVLFGDFVILSEYLTTNIVYKNCALNARNISLADDISLLKWKYFSL